MSKKLKVGDQVVLTHDEWSGMEKEGTTNPTIIIHAGSTGEVVCLPGIPGECWGVKFPSRPHGDGVSWFQDDSFLEKL